MKLKLIALIALAFCLTETVEAKSDKTKFKPSALPSGKYMMPKDPRELKLSEPDTYSDLDRHASLCALASARAIANYNAWRTALGQTYDTPLVTVGNGLGVISTSCFLAPYDANIMMVRTAVGTLEQVNQPRSPRQNWPESTFVSMFDMEGTLIDWTLF